VTHYFCESLAEPQRVLGFESGSRLPRAVRQGCDLIVNFVSVPLHSGQWSQSRSSQTDVEEGAPHDAIIIVAAIPPYCEVAPRKLLEPPCQGELPQQLIIGCSATRKPLFSPLHLSRSRECCPIELDDLTRIVLLPGCEVPRSSARSLPHAHDGELVLLRQPSLLVHSCLRVDPARLEDQPPRRGMHKVDRPIPIHRDRPLSESHRDVRGAPRPLTEGPPPRTRTFLASSLAW
jgi:hypothetical protein